MNSLWFKVILSTMSVLCLLTTPALSTDTAVIDPLLKNKLFLADPGEKIPILLRMKDRITVQPLAVSSRKKGFNRTRERATLVHSLKAHAQQSQQSLKNLLNRRNIARHKDLWLINGMALEATPALIEELSHLPGVASIAVDQVIKVPEVTMTQVEGPAEPNIDQVNAPSVWALGFAGQGTTVAIMDSGVDVDHVDLGSRWRGGSNSWYDPNGEHPLSPFDSAGHGTWVTGLVLGGNNNGINPYIGVAPDAQWIGVKIFADDGTTLVSTIHDGFQWLLDPDSNPSTDDAPDIVNNSWGFESAPDTCSDSSLVFQADVQALKAAGIAVVFSAGNTGPGASTSIAPANYPESFAVGSVGTDTSVSEISNFSAQGPSACDGTIFPEIVAPGFRVRTSDLTAGGIQPDSYALVDGTSFSAPHVSGVLALLLSAFPGAPVDFLETALKQSANDLGAVGTDNTYGYGLVDALAAFNYLNAKKIGFFRSGQWYLDANSNGAWDPDIDIAYASFGGPGDLPVVGDWNGDGIASEIGVFRNGAWYLDANNNGVWNPGIDIVYASFGGPGDLPVVGDWNGDGIASEIGVFRKGAWYLDASNNGVWDPGADIVYASFGGPGDLPVVGDWNRDGFISEIGVFRNGAWYLDANKNGAWNPGVDIVYASFGGAGDLPVIGDWNGDDITSDIGVFRNGAWYLDANNNGAWNPGIDTAIIGFGGAGDRPVTGSWP